MISAVFVDRPRLAIVIAIIITIAGAICADAHPRRPVPRHRAAAGPGHGLLPRRLRRRGRDLDRPAARSPDRGRRSDALHESSSGNDGSYNLTVSFALGSDPNIDTVNVNNRVQTALSQLPSEVQLEGLTVQKRSSAVLQFMMFYSDNGQQDPLFITNYATINVLDELSRTPGVGQASLFGKLQYSMRIWFDVQRLNNLAMAPSEIINAIQSQNVQAPVGRIGAQPIAADQQVQYNLQTKGRLTTPEEFGAIVVRANPDGSVLRVRDVARVEIGAQNSDNFSRLDGKPAVALGIYLSPGANAVQTAKAVNATLAKLSPRFPEGLHYKTVYDSTTFVTDTISEVLKTIGEAFVLVVIVVFLFLGNLRATIIPAVAVPVSLIGTFAVLLLIGYSANTVSLLALVLAIGIVVDDAIVVVENVERVMEEEPGLTPAAAVKKAMAEITAPIIAITLVLLSVFVPIAFIPGPDRRAVPAMRGDDQRRHGDLGHQRADAVARTLRGVPASGRPQGRHHGPRARRHRCHALRLHGRGATPCALQRRQPRGHRGLRGGDLLRLPCARPPASCPRRTRVPSSLWCNCPTARPCRAPARRSSSWRNCSSRCRRSPTRSRSSASRSSTASASRMRLHGRAPETLRGPHRGRRQRAER